MATKIDVLGTTTTATVANTVVYTVPADKVARIRIMFLLEGGTGNTTYRLYVGAGITVLDRILQNDIAANYDLLTGVVNAASIDLMSPKLLWTTGMIAAGLYHGISMPMPNEYFMVASDDVVSSILTAAAINFFMKVWGVEDDV